MVLLRLVVRGFHPLRPGGDGPERALEGVGVRRARRRRRQALRRAHALGQRRVGVVASPLAPEEVGPADGAEAGGSDGDGRETPPRRVLSGRGG